MDYVQTRPYAGPEYQNIPSLPNESVGSEALPVDSIECGIMVDEKEYDVADEVDYERPAELGFDESPSGQVGALKVWNFARPLNTPPIKNE